MELGIINPNCAGIDIGSKSQYVAVGQALEDVKEFGVYAEDLTAICLHLKVYGIISAAMESTGNYWQNLYVELEKHGMEVTLCNGKFTTYAKRSNRLKIALRHARKCNRKSERYSPV